MEKMTLYKLLEFKMKPTLILLLIFLTSLTPDKETNVYICQSKGGKKYHYKEDCRGLGTCSHKIEKLTLKQAKAAGKTLCGWED